MMGIVVGGGGLLFAVLLAMYLNRWRENAKLRNHYVKMHNERRQMLNRDERGN